MKEKITVARLDNLQRALVDEDYRLPIFVIYPEGNPIYPSGRNTHTVLNGQVVGISRTDEENLYHVTFAANNKLIELNINVL